ARASYSGTVRNCGEFDALNIKRRSMLRLYIYYGLQCGSLKRSTLLERALPQTTWLVLPFAVGEWHDKVSRAFRRASRSRTVVSGPRPQALARQGAPSPSA